MEIIHVVSSLGQIELTGQLQCNKVEEIPNGFLATLQLEFVARSVFVGV